jgi:phospholipid/cholesterol/gamma-HCH transport system ATP-binding protein
VIELRAVTIGGFREASLALQPGERCRLLLSSEADVTLFLRLIVGTVRPESGTLLLFGADAARRSEAWALARHARLGLVWPEGGFVSNLKVWENILLPLWYHGDESAERREEEVLALLGRLGVEPERVAGFLAALPASLPTRERRILGVARAMLPEAEVMIYAELLEGLDGETRARLLAETERHHARREGRASLYVASSAAGLPEPFAGTSLRQTAEGRFAPWP